MGFPQVYSASLNRAAVCLLRASLRAWLHSSRQRFLKNAFANHMWPGFALMTSLKQQVNHFTRRSLIQSQFLKNCPTINQPGGLSVIKRDPQRLKCNNYQQCVCGCMSLYYLAPTSLSFLISLYKHSRDSN